MKVIKMYDVYMAFDKDFLTDEPFVTIFDFCAMAYEHETYKFDSDGDGNEFFRQRLAEGYKVVSKDDLDCRLGMCFQ